MGDTAIVLTATTWLIVNALLLSLAGFGSTTYELPSNPYASTGGDVTTTSGSQDTLFCTTAVIVGAGAFGTVGAVLGFGVGAIAGAAVGGAVVGGVLGCQKVRQTVGFILGLAELVLSFFGFLFQLLLFNVPEIPVFLNAIIVLPVGVALGFVGLKTINKAGG